MVSVQDIPQALVTISQLNSKLNDLSMLLRQAKELSDKNWQMDIGVRFPIVVTISPAQQAGMVNQYDTLKTDLVSIFQTLP